MLSAPLTCRVHLGFVYMKHTSFAAMLNGYLNVAQNISVRWTLICLHCRTLQWTPSKKSNVPENIAACCHPLKLLVHGAKLPPLHRDGSMCDPVLFCIPMYLHFHFCKSWRVHYLCYTFAFISKPHFVVHRYSSSQKNNIVERTIWSRWLQNMTDIHDRPMVLTCPPIWREWSSCFVHSPISVI